MTHILVFITSPYSKEQLGLRVQEGIIVDSDPKLFFAQGRPYSWFQEWIKRRAEYQRGWKIDEETPVSSTPMAIVDEEQ
jgi:hypothetical protein